MTHINTDMDYILVTWPDIQLLMDKEGFNENACLANDWVFVEAYGACAYFVYKEWYKCNITK